MASDSASSPMRACLHLLVPKSFDYFRRFLGIGQTFDLICSQCKDSPGTVAENLREITSARRAEIEETGFWCGNIGTPEVRLAKPHRFLEHVEVELARTKDVRFGATQPVAAANNTWLSLTTDGTLVRLDVSTPSVEFGPQIPSGIIDLDKEVLLRTTGKGDFAVIANARGEYGAVLNTMTGEVTLRLNRGDYYTDASDFPVALFEVEDQILCVHATEWHRLDVSDARSGALLTPRGPTEYSNGIRPPHYLDYFHGELLVSPSGAFVADNGWLWHPCGNVVTWSLRRWLSENVWESEDGPSRKSLCHRDHYWDGPWCWVGDHELAVWGYGPDVDSLLAAACVYNVHTGELLRWFAGPIGTFAFCTWLYSWDSSGTAVWDATTGERIAFDCSLQPTSLHPRSGQLLSILGNGRFRLSQLV